MALHHFSVAFVDQIPEPLPNTDKAIFLPTPTGFRLAVDTGRRETQAAYFPEDQDIIDNPAPQTVTPTSTGLLLDLKKDANLTAAPAQLKGVLELSGGRNYEIAAMPGAVAAAAGGNAGGGATAEKFASIMGFAFLGGLLLNLMPCVFPVLFLKGLALVNSGAEERHKLRAHGFVYTARHSRLVLDSCRRAAGAARGGRDARLGIPVPVADFSRLMAGLLFFLGLSLAGQFEIGLTLTSAGGSLAAKQGYAGSFFTGVLAVVVATPCTAPFMGAAIGYALAQPAAVTFAVFTALALGLAAPYLALTLQPAWTRMAASARRVDGDSAPGYFSAHLRHRDLAGVGNCWGIWHRISARTPHRISVACDCRMVPRPLAREALVDCYCRGHSPGIRIIDRFCFEENGNRARDAVTSRSAGESGNSGPPTPCRDRSPPANPSLSISPRAGA